MRRSPMRYRHRGGSRVSAVIFSLTSTVTSKIGTGPGSSPLKTGVIVGAPACTERDRNYEEQDNLPFWSHSRSIPGGDGRHLRVINNVHFHIIDIRIRQSFYAPEFKNFCIGLKTACQLITAE